MSKSEFEKSSTSDSDLRHPIAIMDGIDDVIYVADPDSYELLYVNQAFKRVWGEDVIGKNCFAVLQHRDDPCPYCTNDRIFGEYLGKTYVWENENEATNRWYRCSDKAIQWIDGRMVRFELASEITAAKEAEEALQESESRFLRIVNVLPDMIYSMSLPDGSYEYVSPAAKKMFGHAPEDFYANPLLLRNVIHPDWQEYFAEEWEKLLADEAPPTYEYQIMNADGVRWLNQRNVVVHDDNGAPSAIWGIVTDMTEAKLAAEMLQERIKELSCLQELGRIVEEERTSVEGILERVVQLLPRSWKHTESAAARITLDDHSYSAGDVDKIEIAQRAALVFAGEVRGVVEVGYIDVLPECDEGPFMKEERELIDAVAERIVHVVERIEYERAFRAQKDRLEELVEERTLELEQRTNLLQQKSSELDTIMDSVPGLVFYKDKKNRYIRVNKYVADAHKMTKEELEGADLFELYPREQAQAYLEDDLKVIERGEPEFDIVERWHTEEGERWVNTSKIPFINEQGEITGVIGIAMDITERKEAEHALERKSKVNASINRVFREALSCETVEEVAQSALKVAEELTGSKFGFIGEINDEGKFDTIGISNPGWEACALEGSTATMLIRGMKLRGIWAEVLKSGEARIVNQPDSHPSRVGVPEGHPPLTSFLGVPFIRDGRSVGMIALANKEEGYLDHDQEAIELLAASFYETLLRKRLENEIQEQSALEAAKAALSSLVVGDLALEPLCDRIISFVCEQIGAPTGIMYVADENGASRMVGSHAHRRRDEQPLEFKPGEGLVGQAVRDRKSLQLESVPESYLTIESGLGQMLPRQIQIEPVIYNERLRAVFEFGLLEPLQEYHAALLETLSDVIGAAVESALARRIQAQLLEASQQQTEELQVQQEELKAANEELEEQSRRLLDSESRLKTQQEELQVTNEELEEKTELLEGQKREVERGRAEIAEKAEELALASRYKSEFLANMSHELRTPLNSLLLLSRSLAENKEGNLTADQVESAQVIHDGGNDLLALINEILDLSKIEAGKMSLRFEECLVANLADTIRSGFKPLVEHKGIDLEVNVDTDAPKKILTDQKRVEQVLKNLVSNAVKFTESGFVKLTFEGSLQSSSESGATSQPRQMLRMSVQDTGIGIPPEQQKAIFQAFQQGDGSAARRFGGTGLGLSIVRELVTILGGKIALKSQPGEGSTFTVFLPIEPSTAPQHQKLERPAQNVELETHRSREHTHSLPPRVSTIVDDRDHIAGDDRTMLIIEDDSRFAKILANQCRERGFKVLAASNGEDGVALAHSYVPSGVLLDIKLPQMDGWRVLEMLKEDPATRHIPVHIASVEDATSAAIQKGAIGYMKKPVSAQDISSALKKLEETSTKKTKRVLVVEDREDTRRGIVKLLAEQDVRVDEATGGAQAIEALRSQDYDCMVVDLGLWDFDGDVLLKKVEGDAAITVPPVIVYTARDLTWEENLELRSYSDSVIIKGVRSDERLLDEVSLFLHRVVADMPEKKRQVITSLHDTDVVFQGKKVLIVDDDMRALFALTKLLSDRGMEVMKAENGERALTMLEKHPDVDVVLMDIMMPVLDGYETMRRIRAQDHFEKLPIVALTAKAMRGDQETCIKAGASDYLPKPLDQDRLISMLRVWLYR